MDMLDISKRIKTIQDLVQKDTVESLTYVALESRLTIEYLCYERFKFSYHYLSSDDLKNWQPRHVVKQVSEDIDENIIKGFTLSISKHSSGDKLPKTKEDNESLEYIPVGEQSELNLNKLHKLWNGLANVALHIPVPSISHKEMELYGDKAKIKKQVESFLEYVSELKGNLLMGGPLGEVLSFNCQGCNSVIKKPIKYLKKQSIVNCINPKCNESYLVEPEDVEEEFKITRRIFNFNCKNCNCDLEVSTNVFRELKFNQQLNIHCESCGASLAVIMRPFVKENID